MHPCLPRGHFHGQTVRQRAVGGLNLVETRYAPLTRLPRHSHEHGYFCLVRRGHYQEEYGDRLRSCGPLTLAFHPPGELHAQRFAADETWSFNIEMTSAWLSRCRDALGKTDWAADFQGGALAGLALRLYREFLQDDDAAELAIEGLTLEIVAAVWRQSLSDHGTAAPPWLKRVRELLQDQFAQPPSLMQLASEAGVHPVYLATAFHRHFGCTVGEFVRRRRVEFACQQLRSSRLTLAEVALVAGFSDQSHFSRTFKRLTGLTPRLYRETARLA
jgi:AraC family transcriptional regulator